MENPLFIAFESDEQRKQYLVRYCKYMEPPLKKIGGVISAFGRKLSKSKWGVIEG